MSEIVKFFSCEYLFVFVECCIYFYILFYFMLKNKKILVGIIGGIVVYKSIELICYFKNVNVDVCVVFIFVVEVFVMLLIL